MRHAALSYTITTLVLVGILSLNWAPENGMTGFAVFGSNNQGDFDYGTYNNTEYNTTEGCVKLSSGQTTGYHTSKVFDAGYNAVWNNISWSEYVPDFEYIMIVDAGEGVFLSSDAGETWTQQTGDYGGGNADGMAADSNDYLYILSNKDIHSSVNFGANWSLINDSFTPYAQNGLVMAAAGNDSIFIIDHSQRVWKSVDHGANWEELSDFNAGQNNDARGIATNTDGDVFVVDLSEAVYMSSDAGLNWTQQTGDYGGGNADGMAADSEGNLFILSDKSIYKSLDSGLNWSVANDSFTPYAQNGILVTADADGNLFIIDGVQRVFKSTDGGASWSEVNSDFNGGTGSDARASACLSVTGSIRLQARSCNDSSCSSEAFIGPDGTNSSFFSAADHESLAALANNRYFQYTIYFETDDPEDSPRLYNVSVEYGFTSQAPTAPQFNAPANNTFQKESFALLNATSSDPNGDNITYWFFGDGKIINSTTIRSGDDATYNWTGIPLGVHNWSVKAGDQTRNSSMSEIRHFTVYTTEIPNRTSTQTYQGCPTFSCPEGYECDGGSGTCIKTVYAGAVRYIENDTAITQLSQEVSSLRSENDYLQEKLQLLEDEKEKKDQELQSTADYLDNISGSVNIISPLGVIIIIILVWTSFSIGYWFRRKQPINTRKTKK